MKTFEHPTIFEALQRASSFLKKHGREESVAELAMQHVLQMERYRLLAECQRELSEHEWKSFKQLIEKHAEGIPFQHLVGYEWFYGRKFL